MARKPRIESSENVYHVINRGNYRRFIFASEGARNSFERTLDEACERNGWRLFAYGVLSNHFHLCLGTPKGNLSEGMRWLQATFAARFNRLRKESGHLFQGRFKSLLVEPGGHLVTLVDYIHLNAYRAGLEAINALGSYRWSSLHHFPKRSSRAKFLDCSWMEYLEQIDDTAGGWVRYKNVLKLRAKDDPKEVAKLEKELNRGWCIGSPGFKRAVAEDYLKKDGPARIEHEELNEFNRLQWELRTVAALKALGRKEADLQASKRSEPWKLAIASMLKRETSVTNDWLSQRLHLGVANAVSSNCGVYRKNREARCPYARCLTKLKYEH